MKPELSDSLAQIAAKLTETFPQLVAAERLDALLGGIVCFALVLASVIAIWTCVKNFDEWDSGSVVGGIVAGLILFFSLIGIECSIVNFTYPEAAAVRALVPKR